MENGSELRQNWLGTKHGLCTLCVLHEYITLGETAVQSVCTRITYVVIALNAEDYGVLSPGRRKFFRHEFTVATSARIVVCSVFVTHLKQQNICKMYWLICEPKLHRLNLSLSFTVTSFTCVTAEYKHVGQNDPERDCCAFVWSSYNIDFLQWGKYFGTNTCRKFSH